MPLKILVLGGTGFIGPHFIRAALQRHHAVAVFGRGQADLPAGVERLTGDRNEALTAIMNRDWDAVFDLATYVPNWVRTLGVALRGHVRHYTFISTLGTYKLPGAFDESSAVHVYAEEVDPYSLTWRGAPYGALKVLCEQEAERQFPQKSLIVRAGHIVGPGEHLGSLTYLVARMQQGGRVLVGGDPMTPAQLIDARDLAEWVVRVAEDGKTGTFNATGPALPLTWGELLGAIRGMVSVPVTLTWAPLSWLKEQGVGPWSCLTFWPGEFGQPGFMRLSNEKARAHGLAFRALNSTLQDTWSWYEGLPVQQKPQITLGFDDINQALEHSMAREAAVMAAWSARSRN